MDISLDRLKPLPAQIIEIPGGVALKRGRTEVKILGEGAVNTVMMMYSVGTEGFETASFIASFSPEERENVQALVDHLLQRRLLVQMPNDFPSFSEEERSSSVFYWHFGCPEEVAQERMGAQRILIVGINSISRQLAHSLQACGFQGIAALDEPLLRDPALFEDDFTIRSGVWPKALNPPERPGGIGDVDPDSFDCMVATSDFGAVSVISQWNEYCCLHRRPFLPVVLKDLIGYVGPLVLPGETACFECLKLRERTHQSQPDLQRQIEAAAEAEPPIGLLPPLTSSLGDIASIELVKFYGLGLPIGRAGVIREVNLIAGDISSQVVHRMPRCPICTPLNQRPSFSTVRRETVLHSSG